MAGPILNLIRQLRENRMGGGMGFDRPRLFQPMGLIREQSPAREPITRVGRLLRSIGGGTSRQDYMARRREGMKPLERKTANDAADPDTTYSRLDNSTALSPEESKKTFRVASQSPAVAASQAPEPIQGGVQDLPAPKTPTSELDSLRQQKQALMAKMQRRNAAGYSVDPDRQTAEQLQAIDDMAQFNLLSQEIENRERAEQGSMTHELGEVDALADKAFKTGNWEGYEMVVNANQTLPRDASGRVLPEVMPKYRLSARPAVARNISQIIAARNGFAGASPDERQKLLAGITYAFSPTIDATSEDKRYATSVAERDRIVREIGLHHSMGGDKETADQFWALATAAVQASGGTFRQPQSSWPWPFGGTPAKTTAPPQSPTGTRDAAPPQNPAGTTAGFM